MRDVEGDAFSILRSSKNGWGGRATLKCVCESKGRDARRALKDT